jgi:drug/metabolite transporter (DMT)-like permease
MSLKTLVVLAVIIIAGAMGDVLVSKGMKAVGEITSVDSAHLARTALRAVRQPYVLLGAFCLAIYFFSFLAVLSWADVSLVVPITSLGFLLTTFLAQWALHERVTPQRWAGTLLIIIGVALVARSAGTAHGIDEPPTGVSAADRIALGAARERSE